MNRFHIVVSNYQRLSSFVDNFHKLQGFNPELDAVYILDCSPTNIYLSEIKVAAQLSLFGLEWNKNLFFIRRRNWGVNHGAQLDYFRCLRDGLIELPHYSVFMQEHFLDWVNYVKEDTLPENTIFDLDDIFTRFQDDNALGCAFYPRYGVRIITSNPISDPQKEFFGDGEILLVVILLFLPNFT